MGQKTAVNRKMIAVILSMMIALCGCGGAQNSAPAAQDSTPAAQDIAPAVQDSAPVAQDIAPTVQDSAPAVQENEAAQAETEATQTETEAAEAAKVSEESSTATGGPDAEAAEASATVHIAHRYASKAEGQALLLGNEEYYNGFSRNDLDFKMQKKGAAMEEYKLIHFTVQEDDYPLPPSVFEYHISNPDVEHHNSYATFRIDGQNIDCFTDFVTTQHFEQEGDLFFASGTTALVPVDGSDVYYTPEQAENFFEVFGRNTSYVIDPEECMADNFGYALAYGLDGPTGEGYPNPEIIEGILAILTEN